MDSFGLPIVPEEIIRKPKKGPGPTTKVNWLTSFADLVTLLLTFLVLLISVTSLEPHTPFTRPEGDLTEQPEVSVNLGDGVLLFSDAGLLAPVVELAENIDRLPADVMLDQREIKDAIFQLDPVKTPEFEQLREAADEGVKVFRDNRGLVVQWDRSLLFPEGGTTMFPDNLLLMQKLAIFLNAMGLLISVEGHTNPLSLLEGGTGPVSYELSLRRSKVVMEYLVSLGVTENRFRIGGHGGGRPRTADPDLAWENSRLEIVIYKPEPRSWSGR